jgi:hypothetical protein
MAGMHLARLRLGFGAGDWLSDPTCAPGRAQVVRMGNMLASRTSAAERYHALFSAASLKGLELPSPTFPKRVIN